MLKIFLDNVQTLSQKSWKPSSKNEIFLSFLQKVNFLKMFLSTQIELIWQASRNSCRSKWKITSCATIFAPNVNFLTKTGFEGMHTFQKKLSSFWQSRSWRKGRKFATASQLSCRNWPSHSSTQNSQREEKFFLRTCLFLSLLPNYKGSRKKIEKNTAFLSSLLIVTAKWKVTCLRMRLT